MPIKIDNKFDFEQIVFLRTDAEQLERMVLYIVAYPDGRVTYGLGNGTEVTDHFDYEILDSKKLY